MQTTMMAINPRFIKDRESRMSIESTMTFESLLNKEKLFEGDELFDVFQNSQSVNNASNASNASNPPVQIIKATKRPSAMEFESGEFYFGNDIVNVFNKQPDNDSSMGFRRRSTLSRDKRDSIMSFDNDRRSSMMSLMSLADCSVLENPDATNQNTSQIDATQQNTIQSSTQPQMVESNILPIHTVDEVTSTMDATKVHNSMPIVSNSRTNADDEIEYIEEIGPYDIICGRNNGAHNWVGNRRFRITIMMNLKRYTEAPTREEKTTVIKSVINLLLNAEGVGARFIKKVGEGKYVHLKEKQIREKVGHAFRDMINLAEQEGGKLEAKCFQ